MNKLLNHRMKKEPNKQSHVHILQKPYAKRRKLKAGRHVLWDPTSGKALKHINPLGSQTAQTGAGE